LFILFGELRTDWRIERRAERLIEPIGLGTRGGSKEDGMNGTADA
jgi:hypothetical protein